MYALKLFQLASMVAIFSTQVVAGSRKISSASDLGLIFSAAEDGWKQVKTNDGFFSEIYVSQQDRFIEISFMIDPGNTIDSYEAVLSMWEEGSKLGARKLQHIKYGSVVEDFDTQALDNAFRAFGYDPDNDEQIPQKSVKRDTSDHTETWNSLRATSFGQDALKMCTEFQETSNLYIDSFDFGRAGYHNTWIRVNFGGSRR